MTVMLAGRGRVLLIMLVAVIALAVGETLLSKGMKQVGRAGGGWLDQTMAVVRNGWVGAGLVTVGRPRRPVHAGPARCRP